MKVASLETLAPGLLSRRPWTGSVTERASLAVVLGLAGVVVAWIFQPVQGGDTGPLLAGTEALGRCLAAAELVGCDDPTSIGPYPLLQYLPDLLADAGAELGEAGRRRVLASLSIVGVAAAVVAGRHVLRRVGYGEHRWVLLLTVLSGPVLAYGGSTWSEMLATSSLVVLVAVALIPVRPALVGLAAFAATLTKETGYPFVLALGAVALFLACRRTGTSVRWHALAGVGGVALGVTASSAFNLLRFGTLGNAYYLDPALRTASPPKVAEHAAALFVSPNGGLILFWPLAFVVLAGLTVAPLVGLVRGKVAWRDGWPAPALLAIWLGLTAGLAIWWSPFGWWAWGPRLSLPWILPLVLLTLVAFGSRLTSALRPVLHSRWGFAATAIALIVLALPHVGFHWHADSVIGGFFLRETEVCPGGGPPPTPTYDACLGEQLWSRRPIWLDALAGLRSPGGAVMAAGVAAAIVGSLVLLRRDVGGSTPRAHPPPTTA